MDRPLEFMESGSRDHVVRAPEGWPSGLRRALGKRVYRSDRI